MREYLGELGWLANGWTLLVAVGVILGVVWKWLKNYRENENAKKFNYFSLESFFINKFSDAEDVKNKLKKNIKIVIVDDEPENLPIEYLRRSGFSVDIIRTISLSEVDRLLNYDVVLLDIVGVVEEDARKGGMELLKRIKSHDNSPIVIAISGNRFDPTATDFFGLAEDRMKKPVRETDCEEIIIENICAKFSPIEISKEIDKSFDGRTLDHKQRISLMGVVSSYAMTDMDDAVFKRYLEKYNGVLNQALMYELASKLRIGVGKLR